MKGAIEKFVGKLVIAVTIGFIEAVCAVVLIGFGISLGSAAVQQKNKNDEERKANYSTNNYRDIG